VKARRNRAVHTLVSHARSLIADGRGLVGGCAGAVEDAGGGADVHQQGGADVGVTGHAGHVRCVELPGEQGGGAEHVPQAVPGPPAVTVAVPPAGRQVGALEDVAVEVGGPPVLAARAGEDQPERVLQKVSQETLAEMIGTTRSRVNLFMNKFRNLGFIEYNGEIKINKSLLTVVLHE